MKEVKLKNNQIVTIRQPYKEDAKNMIVYLNKIGGESDFLTFGKNEFKVSLEAEQEYIEKNNIMENSTIIIATIDDTIISIASINSNQKERTKHNGTLGISILKKYWGIGLGSEIMNYMINWAKENQITKRIELLVREDNYKAISLYEKFGFEREGLHRKDICVDGIYYNTIIMALYIN